MTVKPRPVIRQRRRMEHVYADLLKQGMDSWMADLVSRRVDSSVSKESCLSPLLAKLDNPGVMPDMDRAVERITRAVTSGEKVIFCVDHDMDGQAAAAVLWSAFVQHFLVAPEKVAIVTSHRLTEGYGITEAVAERIMSSEATLVISADKGSSDEPRIRKIAAAGKDVVVTDHHALPVEGPPQSAYACVNPAREGSGYDPYISGAGVAWLTMALVRTELLRLGHLREIPSLAALVDFVAVATVADCVSLRPDLSYANRALVKSGLALINAGARPCWQVFRQQLAGGAVNSQTIGFQLAPAVAAAGRLDWAESGFRFLIAQDRTEAGQHWAVLQRENEQRKAIEKELRLRAVAEASGMDRTSLVMLFEDGHSGVHGITASRLVEWFGKPAAMFAPKGVGARDGSEAITGSDGRRLVSGSFRGVPGFHVRDALQWVADRNPGIFAAFGGHAGAAGATIAADDFERFSLAFEEAVLEQLGDRKLFPELWVDGDLESSLMTLATVDALGQLDPWGRDFPPPVFCGEFRVLSVKSVGDGSHLKLSLEKDGQPIDAIWFNAVEAGGALPVTSGQLVSLAYQLTDNVFRGQRSLQLQIVSPA